jgi:hypothetical protein
VYEFEYSDAARKGDRGGLVNLDDVHQQLVAQEQRMCARTWQQGAITLC